MASRVSDLVRDSDVIPCEIFFANNLIILGRRRRLRGARNALQHLVHAHLRLHQEGRADRQLQRSERREIGKVHYPAFLIRLGPERSRGRIIEWPSF